MDGTNYQFHAYLCYPLPCHGNAPIIGTIVDHEQLKKKLGSVFLFWLHLICSGCIWLLYVICTKVVLIHLDTIFRFSFLGSAGDLGNPNYMVYACWIKFALQSVKVYQPYQLHKCSNIGDISCNCTIYVPNIILTSIDIRLCL